MADTALALWAAAADPATPAYALLLAAEDLTSEVFFKVLDNRFSYDPAKAKFSTWIFNIAKNTLIDYCRKKRPMDDIDEETDIAGKTNIEEEFIATENAEALKAALSELNIREYNIVHMRYSRELSYKQIAEEMSLSESNVSVILTRSLKKLKKLLESKIDV
ncbi:DNA-directed RNA polymerase sigma-70 factor [Clostridia bacterium]|nr:DNA-directed RNA polymerase sigma-70 factor [Clostridia bacterium]